jgi:hypothetical protein
VIKYLSGNQGSKSIRRGSLAPSPDWRGQSRLGLIGAAEEMSQADGASLVIDRLAMHRNGDLHHLIGFRFGAPKSRAGRESTRERGLVEGTLRRCKRPGGQACSHFRRSFGRACHILIEEFGPLRIVRQGIWGDRRAEWEFAVSSVYRSGSSSVPSETGPRWSILASSSCMAGR